MNGHSDIGLVLLCLFQFQYCLYSLWLAVGFFNIPEAFFFVASCRYARKKVFMMRQEKTGDGEGRVETPKLDDLSLCDLLWDSPISQHVAKSKIGVDIKVCEERNLGKTFDDQQLEGQIGVSKPL